MTNSDYLIEHLDMSNEAYHAHGSDYISSSFVKQVHKHSVAKALMPFDGGNAEALTFGDAFHTIMESEELFNKRFTIFDDTDIVNEILSKPKPDGSYYSNARMTGKYKAWKQDNYGDLDEGNVISKQDYDKLVTMKANTLAHKQFDVFMTFAESVKAEHSYFTTKEDEYGLLYRVRPDLMIDDHLIFDYKTCQDASPQAFRRDFFKYGYDIQAVFYCWVLGINPLHFSFLAIEKQPPYNVGLYRLSDETIENAEVKMRNALGRIADWKQDANLDGIEQSNEIIYL